MAAIHVVLGYALLFGLGVTPPAAIDDGLAMFNIGPPPPPPHAIVRPKRAITPRRNGAASPPNRRAKASPIVAPVPEVRMPLPPPPVVAAPIAGIGGETNAGAAPVIGPGHGSGGEGTGTGSGDGGDGDGGGGGGTPVRQIKGRIRGSDYPRSAAEAHVGGVVWVHYVVDVKGRVATCRVLRSSGNTELDQTTCRLIVERFRFKPARNAWGKPVPGVVEEDHTWVMAAGDVEEEERE